MSYLNQTPNRRRSAAAAAAAGLVSLAAWIAPTSTAFAADGPIRNADSPDAIKDSYIVVLNDTAAASGIDAA